MPAKVYFTKEISPENVIKLYQAVGKTLSGKTAIKLHSGEVSVRVIPSEGAGQP